ncbi:MAG: N-acetylmuramic acid 6-phosphate etherase [Flavobacteriales bacterium]|nr:N-acetylmuramic acid 6-phosphate etherase [Flavobacteriales bacterium]
MQKTTESDSHYDELEKMSTKELLTNINNEDKKVADVVSTQLLKIAQTAELFAQTLKNRGRVFYIGAGTSGRLGVLDAAECPPTFGTDPEEIIGVISGGYDTLILSQEGVEDEVDAAVTDLKKYHINDKDLVIGIAASRRTPYTLSGLKFGKSCGCKTVFIICNLWEKTDDASFIDTIIELEVGPEVITGSTRMKSGTAQKMTLNLISTTAMVLLGKTYGNLMVDLQAKSAKLEARSRKILMDMFELHIEDADRLLDSAGGSVKTAIVMQKKNCDKQQAIKLLDDVDGIVYKIT